MKLYRICTEWTPAYEDIVLNTLRHYGIDGFTLIRARGYWKDVGEESLIVEIAGDGDNTAATVATVAHVIRAANRQEAVLIQTLTCEVQLCTD